MSDDFGYGKKSNDDDDDDDDDEDDEEETEENADGEDPAEDEDDGEYMNTFTQVEEKKIVVNKANERMSSGFTSYFETARILGDRVAHITHGSPIYCDKKMGVQNTKFITPFSAALMEMQTNKIPFKISRQHLDGTVDIYELDELTVWLNQEQYERFLKLNL
jgi:DNA-directed RNA polymerase subunit K/omega